MKIAVMGAGAVGCYYGGMLARAGHDVVLIGRPWHVEAIGRAGLFMETQSFQAHISIRAGVDAVEVQGAELILFCVKSSDTDQAAQAMVPYLSSDAVVLSLQNGVNNIERLRAVLPQEVAPAVVYVAAEMVSAGHVKHHGRGELVLETSARMAFLVEMFAKAAIPARLSERVVSDLWTKLVINCVYNALSAITQVPYGQMVRGEAIEEVMRDVVQECLAVAQAEGVALSDEIWPAVQAIAATMPGQLSSTAQDLMRHKPSEIDYINGHILRRGRMLGVATPVNRTLYALVKLLEAKS